MRKMAEVELLHSQNFDVIESCIDSDSSIK